MYTPHRRHTEPVIPAYHREPPNQSNADIGSNGSNGSTISMEATKNSYMVKNDDELYLLSYVYSKFIGTIGTKTPKPLISLGLRRFQ